MSNKYEARSWKREYFENFDRKLEHFIFFMYEFDFVTCKKIWPEKQFNYWSDSD